MLKRLLEELCSLLLLRVCSYAEQQLWGVLLLVNAAVAVCSSVVTILLLGLSGLRLVVRGEKLCAWQACSCCSCRPAAGAADAPAIAAAPDAAGCAQSRSVQGGRKRKSDRWAGGGGASVTANAVTDMFLHARSLEGLVLELSGLLPQAFCSMGGLPRPSALAPPVIFYSNASNTTASESGMPSATQGVDPWEGHPGAERVKRFPIILNGI